MTAARPVTLREIARKAGVTRMTVSLALRGCRGVSEKTRRAVLAVARDLGYEPDPALSTLMARIRSRPSAIHACIALLTSGGAADAWKTVDTERKFIEGAIDRAREYGYRVEEFWMNEPGMSPERLTEILWSRGIEGIVIAPLAGRVWGGSERHLKMDFDRFAVVEISETVESPKLNRAIHDQYTAMLTALQELRSLGYRRMGLVLESFLDQRVNRRWTAGFLQFREGAMAGRLPPPLILDAPDEKAFTAWVRRHKPDAIISVGGFALHHIKECGIRIPSDVGYASLDIDGEGPWFEGLSGIDQNSRQVGASAMDMLVAAIQRGQRGAPGHTVRTEVAGTWVQGTSTRRQTGHRANQRKA